MAAASSLPSTKPVQSLVLDAGPILKNDPAVSTLLAKSEELFTVPSVISEIRDATARSRIETLLLPFLTLRSPKPASVAVITAFARRTGDYEVLSRADVEILALAYDLECERNGGDWRLRKEPGQKRVNGPPPTKPDLAPEVSGEDASQDISDKLTSITLNPEELHLSKTAETSLQSDQRPEEPAKTCVHFEDISEQLPEPEQSLGPDEADLTHQDASDSEEGWITPSNIKKHQADDHSKGAKKPKEEEKVLQVATLTSDFAMQNVLLQMNLNLLSPSLQRVRHLKTYILRCHACFARTKKMDKQFCPRCGKPTLMRVSCSTDDKGEFKIHLKAKMQWNNRGAKYSIPKPVSGSANGRVNVGGGGRGGGQGGWGQGLILSEDQKEYVQAVAGARRKKERDLMDDNRLPGILTGEREAPGGRAKVGAGRNVNSKRRR